MTTPTDVSARMKIIASGPMPDKLQLKASKKENSFYLQMNTLNGYPNLSGYSPKI